MAETHPWAHWALRGWLRRAWQAFGKASGGSKDKPDKSGVYLNWSEWHLAFDAWERYINSHWWLSGVAS